MPAVASWLLRIGGAVLLGLLLAGCDGLTRPSPPKIAWPDLPFLRPAATPTPPYRTLTVLTPDEGARTETLRALLAEYDAAHTELRLDLRVTGNYNESLRMALEGSDPPDILVVDSFHFPDLAADGWLAAPDGRLADAGDFYPQLVAAFTLEGVTYCLPREVRTLALVYDRAKFAKAGLEPPRTWGELRAAAKALTDLNTGSFGLIESPDLSRWLPFLYQAGGQVIDANGRMALDSTAAATALDFYIESFRANIAGHPGESNSGWAGEVLGKGKGGMAVEGNWVAPYFAAQFPDYAYGVAPLPRGPGGRGTVAFTSCYAVAAGSEPREAAFALAHFLAGPEALGRWPEDGAWMPPRSRLRAAWLADFPALAPFMEAVDEARVWQFPPGFETFLRSFNRGLVELFAADIDAADLLFEAQKVGEELLASHPP